MHARDEYANSSSEDHHNGTHKHHHRRVYQAGGTYGGAMPPPYNPGVQMEGANPVMVEPVPTIDRRIKGKSERSYYAQPAEHGNTIVVEKEQPECGWCMCFIAIVATILIIILIIILIVFFTIGKATKTENVASEASAVFDTASHNDIISADQLYAMIKNNKELCILEAGRLGQFQSHIQGAHHFSINQLAEAEVPGGFLDAELLSAKNFENYVNVRGVSKTCHVVVYGGGRPTQALNDASQVWWLFKLFGHDRVSVLKGGIQSFIQSSYPLTAKATEIPPFGDFIASWKGKWLKDDDELVNKIRSEESVDPAQRSFQLVDVRETPVYNLQPPIADATNVPFSRFFKDDEDLGYYESIKALLSNNGVKKNRELIIYGQETIKSPTVLLIMTELKIAKVSVLNGGYQLWMKNRNRVLTTTLAANAA